MSVVCTTEVACSGSPEVKKRAASSPTPGLSKWSGPSNTPAGLIVSARITSPQSRPNVAAWAADVGSSRRACKAGREADGGSGARYHGTVPERWVRRRWNGVRKVLAGLTPFGESVWPGVRNDLFVAHLSIYLFFSSFCRDKDVLDAGCGTGYGAALLAERGAASVVGFDLDHRSVRYARRHYGSPAVRFEVRDGEAPALPGGAFDVVVSSNMMEHLRDPGSFLLATARALRPAGLMLAAVPPIVSAADAAGQEAISYHRSNLTVAGWLHLLGDCGFEVELFRHDFTPFDALDFGSPNPSTLAPEEFTFHPTDLAGVERAGPLTVIFAARPTGSCGRGPRS